MTSLVHDATNSVKNIISKLQTLNYPIEPVFDGKLRRFKRFSVSSKSAWYVAYLINTPHGGYPIVCCGDWATNEKHTLKPDNQFRSISSEAVNAAIRDAVEKEAALRVEKQEFAAQTAREEWELANAGELAAYMESKGFSHNYSCRVAANGELLIPTMIGGEISGLQKIFPDGKKFFVSGQKMKGAYFVIGEISPKVPAYLCEGFATGCSINEATGRSVIVAFSASNLTEVARQFSTKCNLIVAADDDRFTDKNPGITAAKNAAKLCGHRFIAPKFSEDDSKSTDFNDLHRIYGLAETRKQLEVTMGEVVEIRSEKKECKRKMSDVYKDIANAMNGMAFGNIPPFPTQYHIIEPSPGNRLILREVEDQVVQYISDKAVVGDILKYAHQLYLPRCGESIGFDQRHAADCMRFWRDYVDPIAEPKMVSWPGEDGYTLRRLPWEMRHGPTPHFDEMMARTSNAAALQCFIGSLFFKEADLQQYAWVKGVGQNGKGALSRFLRKALNGAYSSQMVPTPGDKFWTSGLIGARLVVFPDCNNRTFVASGLFKSLTGGDPIKIEQKGQQPFTTELKAKYMFLSNENPHLSSEKADVRRVIYCEMGEIKEPPRPDYEDDLWNEGGAFLTKCFSMYEEKCKNHGQIPVEDDGNLENVISVLEEEFETALTQYFVLGDGRECSPTRFQTQLDHIWKRDRRTQLEFRNWLERQHGIRKTNRRVSGSCWAKSYTGIEAIRFPDIKVDT